MACRARAGVRFELLPTIALALFGVTFVAEKIFLRGRRVKTNLDRGSLAAFDVSGVLSIPPGIVLGFTDYGRLWAFGQYAAAAGLGIMLAGTALRWAAIRALWSYFTVNVSIQAGQRVVKQGLYGLVRHPAYTGLLLRYLGFGLALANWLSAALVFLPLLFATLYRIRVEEKALREHFGEEYAAYANVTKRLVPGIY